MNTYHFQELQTFNSTREYVEIKAASLAGAKRAASSRQAFNGTVLKLFSGATGELLAWKENGRWTNDY